MLGIVPPSPVNPISVKGIMSSAFRSWTQLVSGGINLIGTGSPEGIVDARLGQQYMDNTGATGSVLYIKRDEDVAGDTKKGWILV